MKSIYFVLIIFTAISTLSAQDIENQINFTGNLSADSKLILHQYVANTPPQFSYPEANKKSPILAGAMSLIIPGAGEIYTDQYLKAGIFLAIEAAVVTTAVVYDNKGDKKTNEFQDYADAYTNPDHNWSVLKYAEWLIQYEDGDPNMIISNDPNIPPWDQVNWTLLNASEKGSHKLPPHGEQQYYELIGKYRQYSVGWNDFNTLVNGSDWYTTTPNMLFYSSMRGDANDYYSVASTAVVGIYINHFLSALDAVWSAISFNKDLAIKVRMDNIQFANRAEFYPTVNFKYSF